MSKREDESWALQKDKLRYCRAHSHYYQADIGCQLCGYDNINRRGDNGKPDLNYCPLCLELSLLLNPTNNLYECLNTKCKETYQPTEIDRPVNEDRLK